MVIICLPDSRSVLNDFYAHTNGPQWTRRNRWGSSSQLERWEGVTVEGIHGWLELSLVENNLSGEMRIISSRIRYCFCEIIFRVLIAVEYHFEVLCLTNHAISRGIPSSNLKYFTCALRGRSFWPLGRLPSCLGKLTNLTMLNLSGNLLTGMRLMHSMQASNITLVTSTPPSTETINWLVLPCLQGTID